MKNILILMGLVLFVFSPSALSQKKAITVAGVSFDNTVQVAGETLVLNGAGIRTKSLFKIYVAGLYLAESQKTTVDVLAVRGAKRVAITILRDLSSDDIGTSFLAALRANMSPEERTQLITQIGQVGEFFSSTPVLKKGDLIFLDHLPGVGLRCSLNGKSTGEAIVDASFYNAVLKVWLGDKAVENSLKKALLQGIGAADTNTNILRRPGRVITENNN